MKPLHKQKFPQRSGNTSLKIIDAACQGLNLHSTSIYLCVTYSNIRLRCRNVGSKSCICTGTLGAEFFVGNIIMQLLESPFFQNIIRNLSKREKTNQRPTKKRKEKKGVGLMGSRRCFYILFLPLTKVINRPVYKFKLLLFLMEHCLHV